MKQFLKLWLKAFILCCGLVILALATNGFVISRLPGIIVIITIGSLAIALVFYVLHNMYVPKRRAKLHRKVASVFNAKPVSDTVMYFQLGPFDFFASIQISLSMSLIQISSYIEIVDFHIPRHQIDRLPCKPDLKFKEDNCNGMETYNVYQANDSGLKRAKKILLRKVSN